jgi:hypothetical protein
MLFRELQAQSQLRRSHRILFPNAEKKIAKEGPSNLTRLTSMRLLIVLLIMPDLHISLLSATDCAIVISDTQSEASEDIYTVNGNPRSKRAAEQSKSHSASINVRQPPLITVTISEVLEEAIRGRNDDSKSKSPEIMVISNDAEASAENQAGPSNPTGDHDGTTDVKDGKEQLREAADVLRKVLRAATDARHGKTTAEFKSDGPIEVNADGVPQKSSQRSRTKAIGGRAQKSKGK